MGTSILIPGADFSASAVGFDAAVVSGLKGLWFFNRGVRESRRNLALGGDDAEILGAPSDQGAFLRFKGMQNFFQTDIPDTTEITHIAAVKSTDTMADSVHSPMFISNFGSGSATGFLASTISGASVYSNANPAAVTLGGSRYTDATQTAVTSGGVPLAATVSGWTLVASRLRADRSQRDNLTAGTSAASNFTNQARVPGAGNFRIGSSFSASWQGNADVAAAVMYNRFITDAELATMAGQIRAVLAHLGIAV